VENRDPDALPQIYLLNCKHQSIRKKVHLVREEYFLFRSFP